MGCLKELGFWDLIRLLLLPWSVLRCDFVTFEFSISPRLFALYRRKMSDWGHSRGSIVLPRAEVGIWRWWFTKD